MRSTKSEAMLDAVLDNRVDRAERLGAVPVNAVDRLATIPLAMAKVMVGAAIKEAIGNQPLKQLGDKGLVAKLVTGEKVPEYLAAIARDERSRTRFALALLKGARVRRRIVIDWDEEEVA